MFSWLRFLQHQGWHVAPEWSNFIYAGFSANRTQKDLVVVVKVLVVKERAFQRVPFLILIALTHHLQGIDLLKFDAEVFVIRVPGHPHIFGHFIHR